MIRQGRGLVCTAITTERAAELSLIPMASTNTESNETAFTVSVDATEHHGVTTGISAHERAATIGQLLTGTPSDLRTPGHMFPLVARPGGALERSGHTEAAVDFARLASLKPAGVIVEIVGDDGHMLRREALKTFAAQHGLLMTSIELLQQHLLTMRSAE